MQGAFEVLVRRTSSKFAILQILQALVIHNLNVGCSGGAASFVPVNLNQFVEGCSVGLVHSLLDSLRCLNRGLIGEEIGFWNN